LEHCPFIIPAYKVTELVCSRDKLSCAALVTYLTTEESRVLCLTDVSVFTCNVQSDTKLKTLSAKKRKKKEKQFFLCAFAWEALSLE
jgi:hypothetical protein